MVGAESLVLPAVQEINFSVGILWESRIFQGKVGQDNNRSGKHSGGKGKCRGKYLNILQPG